MTQAQITDAVCHTYNTAGVHLVLIDEIHRLNPRTTTGAQAADLLKDLTERITKAALDAVQLDHLAEQQSRPTPTRRGAV